MMKYSIFVFLMFTCVFSSQSSQLNDYKHVYLKSHAARTNQSSGDKIAQYLTTDYLNTTDNCGSSGTPAFLCSGVLLRGTISSDSYHSWDPSPASISSGGISFSYLRQDANFNALALGYVNGFIFYPYFYAPDGKNTNIDILCSFPIDGATDHRDQKGCGEYAGKPESVPCQIQNITTSDEWYAHFTQYTSSKFSQCGFDVSDNNQDSATPFIQSLASTILLYADFYNQPNPENELRLETWATGIGRQLPIEAFFYISGTNGLSGAQHDQSDYFTQTKISIPIIEISLPQASSGSAVFTFNTNDQVINSLK